MGYLARSGSDTSNLSYDAMLLCKTNIGGYFFDGFVSVQHSRTLTITSNPVETGAAITDHAYVNPITLTMNIIMSDVHESIIPGQFSDRTFRHTSAWHVLRQIQENRIPVDVYTKLGYYKNMLIQEINAEDTYKTFRGLNATVVLKEIPIARVKTVKISAASQTTIQTEMAQIEADIINQTELSQIMEWIGYGPTYKGGGS